MIKKDSQDDFNINSTVLVAFSTAYIYFCSFIFEWAQCNTYSIPLSFITPSLNVILILGVITGITLIVISTTVNFIIILFYPFLKHWKPEGLIFVSLILIYFLIIGYLFYDIINLPYNIFLWLLLFGIIITLLIIIINSISNTINYVANKLEKNKSKNITLRENKLTINIKGRFTMSIISFILIYPLIVFLFGVNYAVAKTDFQVLSSHPNIILVKKYDDILLCKPYLAKQHILKDSLIIIKISDKNNLVFREKNLGRLKYF